MSIQWDDADRLRQMLRRARVIVLPPIMKVTPRPPRARPPICMFVGSGSLPNLDGITWFIDEVWPTIIAKVPAARLAIYGSVCARLSRRSSEIELYGNVELLEPHYDRARLSIVPLRVGSGLKIKIIEAISVGIPIVTTEVGAQGLLSIQPRPFALARSAHEMAEQVIDLLTSSDSCSSLQAAAARAAAQFERSHVTTTLRQELASALHHHAATHTS